MIPPHRPSFGLRHVFACVLRPGSSSLERVEEAFAEAAGIGAAVWLPSVRAGMFWALKASLAPDATVFGPAFTCSSVHEAMVRSGRSARVLDSGTQGFLLDQAVLDQCVARGSGQVLSEVYGHAYDSEWLGRNPPPANGIRIIDMAMAIPHRDRKLHANEFALVSFGAGKSMYAGWGAIGFAGSPELAQAVRALRDSALSANGAGLFLKRAAEISLRTLAQRPAIFELAKKMRPHLTLGEQPQSAGEGFPPGWRDDRSMGDVWRLPSTRLDRALALWNLKRSPFLHQSRLELAERYYRNLDSIKEVVCPPHGRDALSHFTVRVPPEIRNSLRCRLVANGVFTITLWEFSHCLDTRQFPNAFRLSREVVNLPLSPWMSPHDVDFVCDTLIRCLRSEAKATLNRGSAN